MITHDYGRTYRDKKETTFINLVFQIIIRLIFLSTIGSLKCNNWCIEYRNLFYLHINLIILGFTVVSFSYLDLNIADSPMENIIRFFPLVSISSVE